MVQPTSSPSDKRRIIQLFPVILVYPSLLSWEKIANGGYSLYYDHAKLIFSVFVERSLEMAVAVLIPS